MDEKEKKNHPPEGMREEKQSGHLKPAAGAGNREEMKVLRIGDRAYPELLRHIPDPPEILYAMGDTPAVKKKMRGRGRREKSVVLRKVGIL